MASVTSYNLCERIQDTVADNLFHHFYQNTQLQTVNILKVIPNYAFHFP
jgi:hypothetical protein